MGRSDFERMLDSIDVSLAEGRQVIESAHGASGLFLRTLDLIDKVGGGYQDLTQRLERWKQGVFEDPAAHRREQQDLLHQLVAKSSELTLQGKEVRVTDLVSSLAGGVSEALGPALLANTVFTLIDGHLTRRTLQQGFERIETAFRDGLEQMDATLRQGFERLDARFSWGFSELMWRLDQQTRTSERIAELLTRPLDVQSKELRRRGIQSYNRGWFDEALEDLLDAMAKARVDYVIAYYLGSLYLIHKRDTARAIEFFGKAARYAEPESTPHHVAALMQQGLAYELSEGPDKLRDWQRAAECLERAVKAAPDNLEVRFTLARYLAHAGQTQRALEALDFLIRADPRYVVKILLEPGFLPLKTDIEARVSGYTRELALLVQERLAEHRPILEALREPLEIPVDERRASIRTGPPSLGAPVPVITGTPASWEEAGFGGSTGLVSRWDGSHVEAVLWRHEHTPGIQQYLEQLETLAGLAAQGDLLSLRAALDALGTLPLPVRKQGRLEIHYPHYVSSRTVSVEYTYWGIGGEAV